MAFKDGSVVGGRTVVILTGLPVVSVNGSSEGVAPVSGLSSAEAPALSVDNPSKAQLAEAQALALQSAAATGAPFCADCEQANQKLAAAEKAAW